MPPCSIGHQPGLLSTSGVVVPFHKIKFPALRAQKEKCNVKTTLVVMAAGMGSRYGGLKQIDPIGPNGEIILDYSVL